ncbi:MAG: cation:proton antiporter [Bryobacteraceae bacterium]|nr:cation:proton antiporter [Bryobacteraceae bacterium]MDW8379453.1 cation:proton antiporter [Bryobacterales bacterium]
MPLSSFAEIALILLAAVAAGALGYWLRQPLIVSFLTVGILVGPAGAGIVTKHEEIELFASIGIALLLFVVGLKLDLHTVRTLGPVVLLAATAQIVLTALIGLVICLALGMPVLTAVYVALALTFSSTIIVVKLLSDRREIDALHGRLAVGFLIVQDLAVIAAMIAIVAIGGGAQSESNLLAHASAVAAKGVGFVSLIVALAWRPLPAAAAYLARLPELLVLFGITWAVVLAAAAYALGLSKELGAFLAGASLASTPYREAIGSRLVTMRDFLLLFFFIDLGARLDFSTLGASIGPAIGLSLFVIVGKPLIVLAAMGAMGYRKRTGTRVGLALAQISEFSLILGALGVSVGHLDQGAMGLITAISLVTIGVSTYLINHSERIYERLSPWLSWFERKSPFRESASDLTTPETKFDALVIGLGRYGSGIVRHLLLRNRKVIGVDFDPEALAKWRAVGLPVCYGDASDPDLLDHLPVDRITWVVCTAPDASVSRVLLQNLRQRGFEGKIAVTCHSSDEADLLRLEGADLLLRPYADASEQAADAITAAMDKLTAILTAVPALRQVRLSSTSKWIGHRIADVPIRDEFGVTVLAVSRGGRTYFNPGASFQLFPNDRLFLSGEPSSLERAIEYLSIVGGPGENSEERFAVDEVKASDFSHWVGQTLASLALPSRFGVLVLAVARKGEPISAPDPHAPISDSDVLVVAGTPENLRRLRVAS